VGTVFIIIKNQWKLYTKEGLRWY